MIVYILIEDRVNCYGADFTEIVKVFGNYEDAIAELEYIKEHPKSHTGINGELVKAFSYIECREAHCDNNYVMHTFENGELMHTSQNDGYPTIEVYEYDAKYGYASDKLLMNNGE